MWKTDIERAKTYIATHAKFEFFLLLQSYDIIYTAACHNLEKWQIFSSLSLLHTAGNHML